MVCVSPESYFWKNIRIIFIENNDPRNYFTPLDLEVYKSHYLKDFGELEGDVTSS
jgi:hypothetical protein